MMSHCWVRVGMPVEGPARCTFMITAGISAKKDSPMNSVISEMPGPLVAVKARAPFQEAPMTMPIEASSSSPWTMAYLAWPVLGSWRRPLQWLREGGTAIDGPDRSRAVALDQDAVTDLVGLADAQPDRAFQVLQRPVAPEMQ